MARQARPSGNGRQKKVAKEVVSLEDMARAGIETAEESELPEESELHDVDGLESFLIEPLKLKIVTVPIIGITPLVMNRFSEKARQMMRAAQEAGSAGRIRKAKEPKNFDELYRNAFHLNRKGQPGIPAMAFRSAMINACRVAGAKMTVTKLILWVLGDSTDKDGIELVTIGGREPFQFTAPVRNESGVADLRIRPMWEEGWTATVRIRFDSTHIQTLDVLHLLYRAGMQVGILEGRSFGRKSFGCGWGHFKISGQATEEEVIPEYIGVNK